MVRGLTKEEVAAIEGRYIPAVRVACDEMHPHSAVRGCLDSVDQNPDHIVIMQLVETVKGLRSSIEDAIEQVVDA